MGSVDDLDLRKTIHKENGFYLQQACRPSHADAHMNWQVMRMSAIPHGSQPMAFGGQQERPASTNDYLQRLLSLRDSYRFSVQPWVEGCGTKEAQQRALDTRSRMPWGPHSGRGCCIDEPGYRLPRADRPAS